MLDDLYNSANPDLDNPDDLTPEQYNEDYQFALPPFVGLEVTGDKRYYNSQLGVSN